MCLIYSHANVILLAVYLATRVQVNVYVRKGLVVTRVSIATLDFSTPQYLVDVHHVAVVWEVQTLPVMISDNVIVM